ncbi:MAG: hypothetical protein ABH879_09400 [archaeon]
MKCVKVGGEAVCETPVNQPERKFRAGPISATVWQNQGKNSKGEAVIYRTVSLERGYKDRDNEWQSTNTLRTNDLPKAALVLAKAYEHLTLNETDLA